MRFNSLVLLFLLLFLPSCGVKKIPDKEMVKLLVELYKVDRAVSANHMMVMKSDSMMVYEPLFQKYGYSGERFNYTIREHLKRPAKLKEIYTKALEVAKEERDELRKVVDRESYLAQVVVRLELIASDSTTLFIEERGERAFRWLASPTLYPKWSMVWSDSLMRLYETPQMVIWWERNFPPEEPQLYILRDNKNEKNLRALPLYRGGNLTDKERGGHLK